MLKEKQQHIEQLLAERDMERGEVAKATSHAGAVQQELSLLRKVQEQVRGENTHTHREREIQYTPGLFVSHTGIMLLTIENLTYVALSTFQCHDTVLHYRNALT